MIALPLRYTYIEITSYDMTYNLTHLILLVNMFRPRIIRLGAIPSIKLEYKYPIEDEDFNKQDTKLLCFLITVTLSLSMIIKVSFAV